MPQSLGDDGLAAAYIPPMVPTTAKTAPILFEATIVPHRSLSPHGLRILIAVIAVLCATMALRFWLIGAWPVAGFAVIEIGLAAWLLTLNARRARACELVLLTETEVRIIRIDPRGRREERRVESAWLNVVVEEGPGRVPKLLLAARHVREEIGTVLGETAKRDLAAALAAALYRARNPIFHNPQLLD